MNRGRALAGSDLEWVNQTTLHPVGLAAVLVLGAALLAVPRRWAIVPMIVMACFVAPAQRLVIFQLDFSLLRILVLFAWVRLIAWQEFRSFHWRPLDYAIIAWAVVKTVAYTTLRGDLSALVYMLGQSYDVVGMYFFFRCAIRQWNDIERIAQVFAVLAVPVAAAFLIEKSTGRNAFSFFGGVPEITHVRQGKLRAQGAFAHPIIAGCFWAAAMPLIGSLWWTRKSGRVLAGVGLACSLVIVVACASSTPVAAVGVAIAGACLFPVRTQLYWMRWGAVAMLVFLHFAMEAPVWHLISRIDLVGGSTGWHRYMLIDAAIRNFGEWAFAGVLTTGHWGRGLSDVTNQYILEGVQGGLLTLVLLVVILALSFRDVGLATRRLSEPRELAMAWSIGVALGVHAASFVAVSYFGQGKLIWFLAMAMSCSMADFTARHVRARASATPKARPRRGRHPRRSATSPTR